MLRVLQIVLTVVTVLIAHTRFYDTDAPSPEFAAMVRAQIPSPTVGLLGGDIGAGHPLVRMIGGRWAEPYCSDWISVFALRLAERARESGDVEKAWYFEKMSDTYLAGKHARLLASPPDVLIVDDNDGLVPIMLADKGFQEILDGYAKIGTDRHLSLYRRVGSVN